MVVTVVFVEAINCCTRSDTWAGALSWWRARVLLGNLSGCLRRMFWPQYPQNIAGKFSFHQLSWLNKFLMHDALSIKLSPYLRRGSYVSSSQTLFINALHPSILEMLKPFVGLRFAWGIITKCLLKHSVCFWSHLAQCEAQFDASPLLLHNSHFSRSVRSQNSANTTSQKCTEKTHTCLQQNAAWKSG